MEKHTINIDVNTQKANADVDKLDKNFTDLNKTVENLADTMDMDLGAAISEIEDQLTQLAVQGKQNTEEFKSLAKEAGRLKGVIAEVDAQVEFFAATNADVGQKIGLLEDQMYRMAIAGDTTSAEFRKIQGEAAALKQSVIAVDMALDGMAMTTSQRLSGALGGVAGGFAAAQGAMASFGGESEAVNQAILKVQAAMALTQGVDAIRQAVPAFTALKTSVMGAFQGMTTASKAFALTGIGLVITLIAGAVAAFSSFQKSTDQIIAENKKLTKSFDDANKAIENQSNQLRAALGLQLEFASAAGASEKQLAKIRKEGTDDIIANNETQIKNTSDKIKTLESLEYQRTLGQQASSKDQFNELERNRQKEINIEKNKLNDLKVQNNRERNSIRLETLKIKTQELDEAKAKADEERQANAEAAKQRASERAQQRKDELAKITEAQKEYDENEKTRYMTEQQKEIYEVQKKYDELLAIAKKYGKDNTQILINQKNEENDINAKYAQQEIDAQAERDAVIAEQQEANRQAQLDAQEAFDETYRQNTLTAQQLEIDAANAKYFELIKVAEQYGYSTVELKKRQEDELANIDKKYKEEQTAREKQLADMRIDAVKGGIDAIGNLAGAFAGKSEKSQKRAFNIQKAAGIASATIDTYKSAQAAFASAGNPILGAVFAAIAVAAGIANITKIAKTKFEGGGGAGSVSSPSTTAGAGSITTPEFNIVGGNTANQLATLGQQPVQAYVVSGEVSSAQSLDRNRVQNATL
ncbi:hypothetical protein UFOVP425_35 [uncultured Caudovirales phage]|uniref:Uncharacterized protein n=1 Tax=uncultured Caudovirales phage TaxID=2100421 RepID=A0A6J5MAL3_9CAUD|nr:hypothetical protein UFOVP425_35 [uncultured Caudovirales phage]